MTIGRKYIFIENLPSTNSYAALLLKEKPIEEGTIIHTNFQTAGRGQTGNSWESEEGKNLLFSIILSPSTIRPEDQFIVSKTISLGICDWLLSFTSGVSIKWPNDIYVNNDKIAGTLIESSIIRNELESMIIGIGLNLNQQKFFSNAPNPVSLSIITGKEHDREECLKNIADCLDTRYSQLLAERRNVIDKEYASRLYRSGNWFDYIDSAGQFSGKIISVNKEGRLIIEDRSGKRREYGFKEVEFL
jgi:BirA family transcriptional regulator, biotin operon repressor / biotin---[acetyl-CoA-carboxylase] ligase